MSADPFLQSPEEGEVAEPPDNEDIDLKQRDTEDFDDTHNRKEFREKIAPPCIP